MLKLVSGRYIYTKSSLDDGSFWNLIQEAKHSRPSLTGHEAQNVDEPKNWLEKPSHPHSHLPHFSTLFSQAHDVPSHPIHLFRLSHYRDGFRSCPDDGKCTYCSRWNTFYLFQCDRSPLPVILCGDLAFQQKLTTKTLNSSVAESRFVFSSRIRVKTSSVGKYAGPMVW